MICRNCGDAMDAVVCDACWRQRLDRAVTEHAVAIGNLTRERDEARRSRVALAAALTAAANARERYRKILNDIGFGKLAEMGSLGRERTADELRALAAKPIEEEYYALQEAARSSVCPQCNGTIPPGAPPCCPVVVDPNAGGGNLDG